jgi:hypothetical protein
MRYALINVTFPMWGIRSPMESTKRNITFPEKSVFPMKTGKGTFPDTFLHFLLNLIAFTGKETALRNAVLPNTVLYYLSG